MDKTFDFTVFNRQSTRGILVIYLNTLYAFFKKAWIIFLPIIFDDEKSEKLYYFTLVVFGLFIFLFIKSILSYLNYKFKIEDEHFILKHGILRKKVIAIPFDRIQNINFKQNIIQQLINVTQIEVETAGAKTVEISIKALSKDKAIAIKKHIYGSIKIENKETIETVINKPILSIPIIELFKVGLTENHFKSFLLFIVFVLGLYQQIKDNFKNIDIENSVDNALNNTQFPLKFIVFLILIFLGLSIIISITRVVLNHFNQTVFIKNKTVEIIQGLLNKKQLILKKEKIQSIHITTNPLKKILGISSVVFSQVNSAEVKKKKKKITKIVGCKENHIELIKDMIYDEMIFKNLLKPNYYYVFQLSIKGFFIALGFNIVFISQDLLYLNLLLFPLITIYIYKKFSKSFFKFNSTVLLNGGGAISTITTFFEYYKIQSIQIKQSYFQKKRTLVDIVLHTTDHKIKLPSIDEKEAYSIYNFFLFKTEISTKVWM